MYLHYKLKIYKDCRRTATVYGTADNIITLSDLLLCSGDTRIKISDLLGHDISLENLRCNERIKPLADVAEV